MVYILLKNRNNICVYFEYYEREFDSCYDVLCVYRGAGSAFIYLYDWCVTPVAEDIL